MNRNDALGLYLHMLAVWPAAKQQHGDDTVRAWVDELATFDEQTAQAAASDCKLSCEWFPSFAQFHQSAQQARERFALDARATPALPAATEQYASNFKRLMADARAKWSERSAWITAKRLDDADIKHWRQRVAAAVERDGRDGTGRKSFDATLTFLREELREAGQ